MYLFKLSYAVGSVSSLSGHTMVCRWRSLPRVCRHRASKPQGSSKRAQLPSQVTMGQLICASLSHTRYWYQVGMLKVPFLFCLVFFNLTYNSRWTSSLPSCLWSLGIFPSLPGSRLTSFYRDASSALLQLVNQWLNFTYSRSHAFRYERKNTNPTLVKIELTTSALAGVQVTY